MKEADAVRLIRKTFEAPFEREDFIHFMRELLNFFEDSKAHKWKTIKDSFSEHIASWERVGAYYADKQRIDLLIVHLKKETSLERARTMQRNFIAGYLRGNYGSSSEKNAALVAFVSADPADWRFSLVKLEYALEETEKGELKGIEKFTPARRWSFLVGANEKSHTAQSQLVKILKDDENNPTLERLEEAFDIEPVSDEFFSEYRRLFIETKLALDAVILAQPNLKSTFESQNINSVDFAKKLLGQIVFLYYLQKKGWFGVPRKGEWGAGSRYFLRELFAVQHGGYQNFFNDILEPLFYDALRSDRSYDDHYYSRFDCKIPFLNGGLFDPIGNYDWVNTDVTLPNALFSNSNQTKNGDTGDGILDIFDRYNFTVREDEPYEKEVAIDPELLGKAYEKFNAIRPDNFDEYLEAVQSGKKGDETKFNKKYGVYYTPREIVHYMCQQSLIQYLHTALNDKVAYQQVGSEALDMFGNQTKAGQLDLTLEHQLQEISLADLEMLIIHGERIKEHDARVVDAGRETQTYSFEMPSAIRQSAAHIDQKLAAITVCDPAVGSGAFPVGMMTEIVKARDVLITYFQYPPDSGDGRGGGSVYTLKRTCIENALYGVDIDPGAVEIAKLRLWLSLIVDEEDPQNIKPLPNLDYKLMQGNSLLGLPDGALRNPETLAKLEEKKKAYFDETHPTKKSNYRQEIAALFDALVESARQFDPTLGDVNFDFHTHFSEVFQENSGFDIVIANPPYISYYSKSQKTAYESRDEVNRLKELSSFIKNKRAKGRLNSMNFFIEKGIKVLRNNGMLAYIVDTSINEKASLDIRRYIVQNTLIGEIIYNLSLFDNVSSDQSLLFLMKGKDFSNHKMIWKLKYADKAESISQNLLTEGTGFSFYFSKYEKLLKKIEENRLKLESIVDRTIGVQIGGKNMKFEKQYIKDLFLFREKKPELNLYKNVVNISRYSKPVVDGYINFDLDLGKRVNKAVRSANIALPNNVPFLSTQKIILRQSSSVLTATVSSPGEASEHKFFQFKMKNYSEYNLEYLLGIINSTLLTFYALERNIIKHGERKQPQIRIKEFVKIPIAKASGEKKDEIKALVIKILDAKEKNPTADTSALEAEIDQLVYQLYGLTEDEIAIVEGEK